MSAPIDVLVVGAGPAGLAAAVELRRRRVGRVVVLEREAAAGGVPRHTGHTGFGWRDLRRILDGPAYAARWIELATEAGVELRTSTSVTEWEGPHAVTVTAPGGRTTLEARAVLLATGCRERPRAARLVPGSRPLGVLTTGTLQQLVYLHKQAVGRRAVVVGAEHVSFSAVLTLAHAGVQTVAMVTDLPADQTWAPLRWIAARRRRVPILTGTRVARIVGRRRVEGVEVTTIATGATQTLACDTIVFTGDWIPDHELARGAGLAIDPGTHGPVVDGALRTSMPGVFAAGNLVHAAEAADVAALGGRHAARSIATYLSSGAWPIAPVPLQCTAPLAWVAPSALVPKTPPPRRRLLLRVSEPRSQARIVATQGERTLWRSRRRRLVPNRSIAIPARWTAAVAPDGGPVTLGVT